MKTTKKLRNIGIFSKITLLTTVVIVTISTLSTIFVLQQFSGSMKEKDLLLIREASEKIYDFTKDKYNNIYNQRNLLHSSHYIAYMISTTRQNPSEIYESENLNKIIDYLTALIYSDDTICDAILFTADSEHAFSHSSGVGRTVSVSYDFNSLPYIKEFSKSDDMITMIYDSDPSYLTLNSKSSSPETISFIAKIYDTTWPAKKIATGYLMVNFSPDSFFDTINKIGIISNGSYYIVNAQNQIVYSNDPSVLNLDFAGLSFEESSILLNKSIGISDIHVIGSVSDAILQEKINTVLLQMAAITLICILCMVFIITLLHKYYANKFQQLGNAMLDISSGNFDIRLPVKSQDEIGYLSHAFNTMCETLDAYIQKSYAAETRRRTAELYALQAQINPHFLANTLESIRMYALENGNYEIAEMLKKFGNLFQCMVQFDSDIIDMADEMEYITSYLDLQKFRFLDQLSVNIDFPANIYNLGIPRFTLQPVVENALSYWPVDSGTLVVTISFSIENDVLTIRVYDNGPGIRPDTLKRLNEHVWGIASYQEFGVALRNIHSRITLLYGPRYGLHIDSNESGTTVTITLPAQKRS